MSTRTTASHTFTKLIVADLEKMAAFYQEVYGLEVIERIQSSIGADPIDEIMLGRAGEQTGVLVLLTFLEKAPPEQGEVIVGFVTEDVEAVYAQVIACGGGIHAKIKEEPGSPYKVGFATDPEGHLAEIVQMLP